MNCPPRIVFLCRSEQIYLFCFNFKGEHDVDRHDVGHETLHSISTIHYHELFPTLLPLNDIAVLQISPAANLSRVVQTIALPKHRYKVPNGLKCIAKGGDLSLQRKLLYTCILPSDKTLIKQS